MWTGYSIPSVAYGTGSMGSGQWPIDQITQAFDTGFYHIGECNSKTDHDTIVNNTQILLNFTGMKLTLALLSLNSGWSVPTYSSRQSILV
jgi:hypothetical protein